MPPRRMARLARPLALAASVAALGWVAPPTADAMQMKLTRPELCQLSDAVAIVDVLDVETTWAPNGLERRVMVQTVTLAAGDLDTYTEVVLPGGRMGDFFHWVEDVPELDEGQRYMLFLERYEGQWVVIGGDAGAVTITEGFAKGESSAYALKTLGGCDAR